MFYEGRMGPVAPWHDDDEESLGRHAILCERLRDLRVDSLRGSDVGVTACGVSKMPFRYATSEERSRRFRLVLKRYVTSCLIFN